MINKNISKLKIVELANVLAGPMVGSFFSELGAEVIKIEYPGTEGDVTRSWKLPSEDDKQPFSAYYCSANYGKTSLMLDLNEEDDYDVFLDQVREADILITNYPPSGLEKLSADKETLIGVNSSLIFGHLISFRNNPERPAYDVLLQAETGYLSMTGQSEEELAKMPVALIDLLAGHQLKEGLLLALLDPEEFGQYISVALDEAAVSSLANQATNWLMAGYNPEPMGTRHPNIAPYGDLYQSREGIPFTLAIGSDRQFQALVHILNWEEGRTEKFSTNQQRVAHRDQLNEQFGNIFSHWPFEKLYRALLDHGVPVGEIRKVRDVLEREEYANLIREEQLSKNFTSRRVHSTVLSSLK